MTDENEEELGQKYSMVNPYELFDKLERYPAEIFKQVFLLLKKYDQHIASTGTTDGFDISNEPWEVQMAFDYNKDFIESACLKWLKKAAVARENGKKGGRPQKDAEKRLVKKAPPAQKALPEPEKQRDSVNKSVSKNRQKPNRFFCAVSKPNRIKKTKNNPVGHNVYMYKCLNVSGCNNVDRDIGGVGEKGKGCITCGKVVDMFKTGGKAAFWAVLNEMPSLNAKPDG